MYTTLEERAGLAMVLHYEARLGQLAVRQAQLRERIAARRARGWPPVEAEVWGLWAASWARAKLAEQLGEAA